MTMTDYQTPSAKNVNGVRKLFEFYEKGQVSEFTARVLNAAFEFEASKIALDWQIAKKKLVEYEKIHNKSTVEWALLSQTAGELRNRLEYLSGPLDEDIEKLTKHAKRDFNKANNKFLSLNLEMDKRLAEMKDFSEKRRVA